VGSESSWQYDASLLASALQIGSTQRLMFLLAIAVQSRSAGAQRAGSLAMYAEHRCCIIPSKVVQSAASFSFSARMNCFCSSVRSTHWSVNSFTAMKCLTMKTTRMISTAGMIGQSFMYSSKRKIFKAFLLLLT